KAAGLPASDVRRAAMLAGNLGVVATAALAHGRDGLGAFRLTVLQPVLPMLAQTADSINDALARIAPASVEWKLDGARVQVHRLDHDIRVFTRNLADITARVPEIVSRVAALPVRSAILDGEAIALRPDS